MLNKKEKWALCETIASWEYLGGFTDSVSGAMSRADCSRDIVKLFNLKDDPDLLFWRVLKLHEITKPTELSSEDDVYFDCLMDYAEENGYEALLDLHEQEEDLLYMYFESGYRNGK